MRVKIGGGVYLRPFPFGKLAQNGRACFACQTFAIESDLFFPHGERNEPFAVGEVKMDFVAFQIRFAVDRCAEACVRLVVILLQNVFDKIVGGDLAESIVDV